MWSGVELVVVAAVVVYVLITASMGVHMKVSRRTLNF